MGGEGMRGGENRRGGRGEEEWEGGEVRRGWKNSLLSMPLQSFHSSSLPLPTPCPAHKAVLGGVSSCPPRHQKSRVSGRSSHGQ